MPSTDPITEALMDVGGDFDGWGAEINVTFQDVDTKAKELADALDLKAPLADPTFTGTITGNLTGNVTGSLTGNASGSAASLETARAFSITGDVEAAAVNFDGTSTVALAATLSTAKQAEIDAKIAQTGGTYVSLTKTGEGAVLNHGSAALTSGKVTVSSSAPTGGSNGDIWLQI